MNSYSNSTFCCKYWIPITNNTCDVADNYYSGQCVNSVGRLEENCCVHRVIHVV